MYTMRALEYYSKNNNLWNSSGAVYNDINENNKIKIEPFSPSK